MERAILQVISRDQAPEIPVLFNPTDYTVSRNMSYAEIAVPGLPMPLLQFIRGEARTLQLELFLDSSDRTPRGASDLAGSPSAEDRLVMLRTLVTIDGELHAPPVVRFRWGRTQFDGVVTSYQEKLTMFDPRGNILRARVSLQLKSYISAESLYRETNPQSPDRTRTHAVRQGERLDMIAGEVYGDPALWPVIARANGLARPRILPAGLLLVIPPLQ
jgi:contractile injection system tube protein/tail protein X